MNDKGPAIYTSQWSLKASILCQTQFSDLISCHRKPMEQTNEIAFSLIDFISLPDWFPVATDQIVRLSLKVDLGH